MPNVAGVQFPYTPQGEQAAQLYQRSLSPRRGLGFRPIRMEKGGSADGPDIYFEFLDVLRDGDAISVMRWLTSGGNLAELNFSLDEHEKKTGDTGRRKQIEDAMRFAMDPPMSLSAITEGAASANREIDEAVFGATAGAGAAQEDFYPPLGEIEQYQGHPRELGRVGRGYGDPRISNQALRAMGDTRPSDQDSSLGPVFHGGFTPPEKEYFERAFDANQARQQGLMGTPPGAPPAQFAGPYLGVPQGMAHGGVPRGTVAGELEPRGYLTARQAGETMRERAKGLRDRRNYGGGIGSLYNRYG